MKIFQSAILKMTTIYSAILLALCIGFSISIYAITVINAWTYAGFNMLIFSRRIAYF